MDAHRRTSRFWSVLALTFFAAIALAATQAAPARAQDANPDVLNKVTKLNKRALDAYQKKDYTSARALLKDALDLCANTGLGKHPIKARTHIHLGIVLINGFKQRDAGLAHFKKALQIQPDIQLTKTISTPALQEAFEEASVGLGAPGAGGGADDDSAGGGAQAGNDDAAGGGGGEASGDEGQPQRRRMPAKKKKHRGDDDGDDGGAVAKRHGDGDDDDDDDAGVGGNNAGRIFIGLTLGTGAGIASGNADITANHTLASAGFAVAQLGHVSPEVGYYISSKLLLSLQGRFQYVSGLNPGPMTCNVNGAAMACVPKTTALAGFARATYFLLDGDFHVFAGGSLGFGTIRHVSLFDTDHSCGSGSTQCVDSIKSGPVLFGPNVGISFDLGKTVTILGGINTQLGVPRFTFNIDLNVGLGIRI